MVILLGIQPTQHLKTGVQKDVIARLAPAGSEVMQPIAAPMIGGMLTAPLLSMFVIPAAYLLMRRRSSNVTAVK